MNINALAVPPLIIAIVATVLYGFDAFNSFSYEPTQLVRSESVVKRLVQESSKRQNFQTPAVVKQSETRASSAAQVLAKSTAAIASPGVMSASSQNTQSSTNELSNSRNTSAVIAAIPVEEADEELTQVAHESFDESGETLTAITPSMATQATPVEMSDEGQIEADTTAEDS